MSSFPETGMPREELDRCIAECRAQDPDLTTGAPEVYWPVIPPAAFEAARSAWAAYAHLNAYSTPYTPGFARIDVELRAAVADLFHAPGPEAVTITAGGTEGNFLAVKSAREWARAHRLTASPVMVLPRTAHPSFDKAGHELGVAVRRVGVLEDWRADPAAVAAAIDEDTILTVASMPSYPHGAVDDVPAIAALAAEAGIWMHVDAAVGGFIAPHMRVLDPTMPAFSAEVPGVRSITADLHKLGFCLNGISTFTVADLDDRQWPRFSAQVWPHGGYIRQGFLGSRPAAVVAAAWAVISTLGRDGYLQIARTIRAHDDALYEGLLALDGYQPVIRGRLGITAARPLDRDLNAIITALHDDGLDIATNTEPPSLQLFSTPAVDVPRLLDALARARTRAGTLDHTHTTHEYGEGS